MTTKRVGVEIAASGVRVVQVDRTRTDGIAVVSRLAFAPLEPGVVVAGEVRRPEKVAYALGRALKAAGVPKNGFILGMAGPNTGVARMNQPKAMTPEERPVVARAGRLILPGSINPESAVFAVDVTRIKVDGEGHELADCVVAAATPSQIEVMEKICQLAGVFPRAIDLSASAVSRSMIRVPVDDETVATLIDIGLTCTTVITRQGAALISTQTINRGGQFLTDHVKEATGQSVEEAEQTKRHMRVGTADRSGPVVFIDRYGTGDNPIAERGQDHPASIALDEAAATLVEQIANAVATSTVTAGSFVTQAAILAGGGAQMEGLKEMIAEAIGAEVRIGKPWAAIEPNRRNAPYFTDKHLAEGHEDQQVLLSFATAIGLGLWKESR